MNDTKESSCHIEQQCLDTAVKLFIAKFGTMPTIAVTAPGRVNLIGEHIDYCDGFVFPMALEQCTVVVGKPNGTAVFQVETASSNDHGIDTGTLKVTDLKNLKPEAGNHWGNYVKGVMFACADLAPPACDIAIATNVPIGGGLSSSAALEVSIYSFLQAAATGVVENNAVKALACQKAEQNFAHVPCGCMDQFISTMAQPGNALLLDCISMETKQFPIPSDVSIVVTNSNVKHALVDGEYAKRRASTSAALKVLKAANPAILTWRDATTADLEASRDHLDEETFRRGRHVISEISRVAAAQEAFLAGDLGLFGKIMVAGHLSLKDDFNVTVPETDKIVQLATEVDGVYGARMTGGGFGGCVVSLVKTSAVSQLIAHLNAGLPQVL